MLRFDVWLSGFAFRFAHGGGEGHANPVRKHGFSRQRNQRRDSLIVADVSISHEAEAARDRIMTAYRVMPPQLQLHTASSLEHVMRQASTLCT